MRKLLAGLAIAGLAVAAVPGSASAAGTKTIKKEVTFTAPVPAPIYTDVSPEGCLWDGSQEDVNKDTYNFTTPKHRGKGTLNFRLDNFEGDWDLYVLNKDGDVLAESTADETVPYETVILKLSSATSVDIVACNWQSTSPSADGHLAYKYKK
jgi:hypothetical protein